MDDTPQSRTLTLHIGHDEVRIRRTYETLSILNDFISGTLFVIGSILFFNEATVTTGTWLFLIGSFQMVIRPGIRLARRVHLTRYRTQHTGSGEGSHESSMDF